MVTIAFKGSHFERDVILWAVRRYVAYPFSYRPIAEMMEERGVEVDHSTLNRWVLKICAGFGDGVPGAQAFRGRRLATG
jgi:transposase-like protein